MNVAAHIERGRRGFPARIALRFEGEAVSYAALDARASRAAHALRQLGVQPGDRVALCLANSVEFIEAYLGGLKLGAIVVSLPPGLTAGELAALLADCGAHALVTTAAVAGSGIMPGPQLPALQAVAVVDDPSGRYLSFSELTADGGDECPALDVPAETPAVIVYTSGTTGEAKGVVLSHGNIVFTLEAERRYQGIGPGDGLLLYLPLHHCFGQNAIMNAAWHAGAAVVLHRKFDAPHLLDTLARDHVTQFYGVPTAFQVLLDLAAPGQLAGVRYCFSAAAPLPLAVEQRWRERFGLPIYQGYGLTETSPFASYNHLTRHVPGSIGQPIDGVEMAVVDPETRQPLDAGVNGEIVIRGPNVMLGYWNKPEATAAAVRDGWFATGDIGERDAGGYYFLRDRLKDMIVVGGSKVYPAEVENVLLTHPAVAEAAVIGVPDALLSERVVAAIVPRPGVAFDAAAVVAHCRRHLAAVKVPTRMRVVTALPKSRTGKTLKRELRARWAAPVPSAASAAHPTGRRQRLRAWLETNLGRSLTGHGATPLAELGLTSVQAVELALEMSGWLERDVPPTVVWSHPNFDALAAYAEDNGGEALSEEEAERELARELERMRQGA